VYFHLWRLVSAFDTPVTGLLPDVLESGPRDSTPLGKRRIGGERPIKKSQSSHRLFQLSIPPVVRALLRRNLAISEDSAGIHPILQVVCEHPSPIHPRRSPLFDFVSSLHDGSSGSMSTPGSFSIAEHNSMVRGLPFLLALSHGYSHSLVHTLMHPLAPWIL
jgi:hypothetical protein